MIQIAVLHLLRWIHNLTFLCWYVSIDGFYWLSFLKAVRASFFWFLLNLSGVLSSSIAFGVRWALRMRIRSTYSRFASNSGVACMSCVDFWRAITNLPARTVHSIWVALWCTPSYWAETCFYLWLYVFCAIWPIWSAWSLKRSSWWRCILITFLGSCRLCTRWCVLNSIRTHIVRRSSSWCFRKTFWSFGFRMSFWFAHDSQSFELKFKVVFKLVDTDSKFAFLLSLVLNQLKI